MLQPGDLIHARYYIVGLVGQGAMGAVYEAVDQRIGQPVALKQTLTADPAAMGALEREGLILAGLRHPALPTVSDTFSDQGGQFLAMTFVPGPNLAELLAQRGRPFEPAEVLVWADQLLDALAYLHGQAPPVLHRDIKPQNLKLTPDGRVVLLDFGLARGAIFQTRLAGQRSVVGYTLPYAPIEQVRGQDTDPRSDLFALAGTLYHLLAGAPPPDALERAAARIAGQLDPLRPLSDICPDLPAPAAHAIDRCLRLDPAERSASAAELRRALREPAPPPAASPAPTSTMRAAPPRPGPARQSSGWGLVAILLIALACIGPGTLKALFVRSEPAIMLPTDTAGELQQTVAALPTATPNFLISGASLTATALATGLKVTTRCDRGSMAAHIAFSADGRSIAVSCADGLKILRATDGALVQFTTAQTGALAISPSGELIAATSRDQDLLLWQIGDGTLLRRITLGRYTGAMGPVVFSPDSQIVSVATAQGLLHYRVSDGSQTGATDLKLNGALPRALAYSADGRYLAGGYFDGTVRAWSLERDQLQLLFEWQRLPLKLEVVQLLFELQHNSLVVVFNDSYTQRLSLADGAELTGLDRRFSSRGVLLAISPDETLRAVGEEHGSIAIYDNQDGTWLRQLRERGDVSERVLAMAFAPDGRSLAALSGDSLQIWAIDRQELLRRGPERQPQE